MFHKSTHVHFQKIYKKNNIKKFLENLDKIFLVGKHPQNGKERKTLSWSLQSPVPKMEEI